jgi:hypothetical protein
MARSVTGGVSKDTGSPGRHTRTYIVVPILDEESNAGALDAGRGSGSLSLQAVLCGSDIVEQFAVREAAAGKRVDNGGGVGVMRLDGLE